MRIKGFLKKDSKMTQKILVTGGAGFLGSHLTDHLLDMGHDVVIMDDLSGGYVENIDKRATFFKADISNKKKCDEVMKGIDLIYHLAAHAAEGQSVFCPIHNASTNYMGSLNLAVAAINNGVKRFVFTSSMARYGKQEELPMHEGQDAIPEDPYGITKKSFEEILDMFKRVYGMDYVVLVPHNIFGPRQNMADPYRNVVGIFINRILQGKPPMVYGDGLQKRAFTYIDDCIPYIAKAGFIKEALGKIMNIGPDEEPITVKEVAQKVIKVMNFDGEEIHMPPRPLEVKYAYCSADKARKILGYKTSHTFDEGLKKYIEWAKIKGSQKFKYWDEFEIKSDKIPRAWSEKLL